MKKIFILLVILSVIIGCKKANYYCYDQEIDAQGNVTPGTTGLKKKHFNSASEALIYQQNEKKACVEQH